jgi:bla regulator protein BlaR1
MISAFVLYALLVSMPIGAAALLLEWGLRRLRRPTRFVWAGAMLLMLGIPVAGVVLNAPAEITDSPRYDLLRALPFAEFSDASQPYSNTATISAFAPESLQSRVLDASRAVVHATQEFDGLLLGLWATCSAFLLGMTLYAMSEARRLRLGLATQVIDGTTVLVSEALGPSAAGGAPGTIILPRWVLTLDSSLRDLILRHEQEHLAARDTALLTTAMFMLVAVPWHPVLWWSWRRLRLAIEVDCDARVLRAQDSPRTYGQLLLLMTHQRSTPPLAERPLLSLAAPLHPYASQLKQRIDAMTTRPTKSPFTTLATMATGALATTILVAAVPAPPPPGAPAAPSASAGGATVRISKLGSNGVEVDSRGEMLGEILIYGSGPVKVGIGTNSPQVVADTIRLKTLPAFIADVTDGDVHIELRGVGEIEIGGDVTGGPAVSISASGRHLVLMKGGTGIRTMRP